MKNVIDTVFIIHTRFHYYFLSSIESDILFNNILILTSSDSLYDDIIKNGFKNKSCHVEKIDSSVGIKQSFLNSPIKHICLLRDKIKILKDMVFLINKRYHLQNNDGLKVFIANEKDWFTQLFILNNPKSSIYGFEDGAGTYSKPKNVLLTRLLVVLYPIFFYVIAGAKLNYYSQYGTASFIKTLYLRYPHRKNVTIPIVKVKFKNRNNIGITNFEKRVLIFTSPFTEFNILNISEEIKKYDLIVSTFLKHNYKVFIKQHPAERELKIPDSRVFFLNKDEIGEMINYFDYQMIVNFSSSVIFDIIDCGYPNNRILTIVNVNGSKTNHLFKDTYTVDYNELTVRNIDNFVLNYKNN